MKVKLNVNLKLADVGFHQSGHIFDGSLESFPEGIQILVKTKSLQVSVLAEETKPKPIKLTKKTLKKLTKKKV